MKKKIYTIDEQLIVIASYDTVKFDDNIKKFIEFSHRKWYSFYSQYRIPYTPLIKLKLTFSLIAPGGLNLPEMEKNRKKNEFLILELKKIVFV